MNAQNDERCDFLQFSERPLGTPENRRASQFIAERAVALGCEIERIPLSCQLWEHGSAHLERAGVSFAATPGDYSPPFDGRASVATAQTLDALAACDCAGKILFLHGPIAAEPLMPKDFPFYFPEEHRALYAMLEEKQPAAIVAVTGQHPSCGLSPFALITDATFRIPTAAIDAATFERLQARAGEVTATIDSRVVAAAGEQVVARMPALGTSRGKLVVCAHMDSAYGTPGALDNASGVAVLLDVMARLRGWRGDLDLEFVPFNGEDSYGTYGELAWLDRQREGLRGLVGAINLDAVGHRGSQVAVSSHNLTAALEARLARALSSFDGAIAPGEPWFEGDQAMFAAQGIPTLVLSSSDLRSAVMKISHTSRDTVDQVDRALLGHAADLLEAWIRNF